MALCSCCTFELSKLKSTRLDAEVRNKSTSFNFFLEQKNSFKWKHVVIISLGSENTYLHIPYSDLVFMYAIILSFSTFHINNILDSYKQWHQINGMNVEYRAKFLYVCFRYWTCCVDDDDVICWSNRRKRKVRLVKNFDTDVCNCWTSCALPPFALLHFSSGDRLNRHSSIHSFSTYIY